MDFRSVRCPYNDSCGFFHTPTALMAHIWTHVPNDGAMLSTPEPVAVPGDVHLHLAPNHRATVKKQGDISIVEIAPEPPLHVAPSIPLQDSHREELYAMRKFHQRYSLVGRNKLLFDGYDHDAAGLWLAAQKWVEANGPIYKA